MTGSTVKVRRMAARLATAAIISVSALAGQAAFAAYTFTSIANSTTLSGVTTFGGARINDSGNIAYLTGSGASESFYMYSSGTNANARLVGVGDAVTVTSIASGNPAVNTTFAGMPSLYYTLDSTNRLTFLPTLTQISGQITTLNNNGIFRYDNGTLTTIAQKGITTINGTTIGTIGSFDANNAGDVAFQVSGPTWAVHKIAADGTKTTLIQAGDTVPGLSSGVVNTFAFPDIENNGGVSYLGVVGGNPIATRVFGGIAPDGTDFKYAANGDTAPGIGAFSDFFGKGVHNESGASMFIAGALPVVNGSPSGNELRGLWSTIGGSTSLIALQGQSDGYGSVFARGYDIGSINSSGVGVFTATGMTGASTSASYVFNGTSFERLLGIGDILFGSTVAAFGTPTINNSGVIAMNYRLANGEQGVLTTGNVVASPTTAAPEPGTLALASGGFLMVGLLHRRGFKSRRGKAVRIG